MTVLKVPQYYFQRDSDTKNGDRMCFSSTVAMAIKYLKPDALMGSNADDTYLKTVLKYGDTTEYPAQIRAASDYGIKASFFKNGTRSILEKELEAGYPVACGILHRGPAHAPQGGGHWMLVIGLTDTHVVCHDPFGEMDNANGGYPQSNKGGKSVTYTWKNWSKRWMVEGNGSGWYMTFRSTTSTPITKPFSNSWAGVKAVAAQNGAKFPEVVAAQWALESFYGKHTSGKNNFFGIKGTPGTSKETKEFVNNKWITIVDTFKDYPTPEACIKDLITRWYKDYKQYKGINRANSWEECCFLLKTEGYATDPTYPHKLIKLIKENN
jgi:hypothetical protein